MPRVILHPVTFKRSQFYQRLRRGGVGFHILWVTGDYEKAESSFLKINKSGRQLSEWETKLIENRNSSFARAVMSIANITSASHYWPNKAIEGTNQDTVKAKIDEIAIAIDRIHTILFKPSYESPIKRLQQPLLVAPDIQTKPYYLAELLTVIKGGKGQESETKKLLEKDQKAPIEELINNGWQLLRDTLDAFSHIAGSSPRSLALVPVLYFYTDTGRYVRSLLYGLLYWLLSGSEEDILNRKRVLAIHRASFEQMLLENKEDIVSGITRKTGSGPDVTNQTAQYCQGLLELLVKHKDNIASGGFLDNYAELTKRLTNKASKPRLSSTSAGRSRTFTPNQKRNLVLSSLFGNPTRCGICNGMLDPLADLQHDHIVEVFKGGKTLPDNQRLVHPFCNNQSNREIIESGRSGKESVKLPKFIDPDLSTEPQQLRLSFFDDPFFDS